MSVESYLERKRRERRERKRRAKEKRLREAAAVRRKREDERRRRTEAEIANATRTSEAQRQRRAERKREQKEQRQRARDEEHRLAEEERKRETGAKAVKAKVTNEQERKERKERKRAAKEKRARERDREHREKEAERRRKTGAEDANANVTTEADRRRRDARKRQQKEERKRQRAKERRDREAKRKSDLEGGLEKKKRDDAKRERDRQQKEREEAGEAAIAEIVEAAESRSEKADRGLAQIRRDWLERLAAADAALATLESASVPAMPDIPPFQGAGGIYVGNLLYAYLALHWTPIGIGEEDDYVGGSECLYRHVSSYQINPGVFSAFEDALAAWFNAATVLPEFDRGTLDVGDLWAPMRAGFDREEWQPGRVRADAIREILDRFFEATGNLGFDFELPLQPQFHGESEHLEGPIVPFQCDTPSISSGLEIYHYAVTNGGTMEEAAAAWGVWSEAMEGVRNSLASVPPRARTARACLEEMKGAIRPFRHGKQFKFRGE